MKSIIDKIKSLGWAYLEEHYPNGDVMTYIFRRNDAVIKDAFWEVSVEDHHDEGDCDDWLIYSRYHDPDEKDWFGNQIDTHGCVEYETMKLIMKFVACLESKRKWRDK